MMSLPPAPDEFAPGADDGPPAGVIVATEEPLPLVVEPIQDDRAPEGMVVLGSFLSGRLVARCAVPEEAVQMLHEREFFTEPTRLVLAAREAPPGLQCQLFALVDLKPGDASEADAGAAPDEPWAAGLPGAQYDAATGFTPPGQEEAERGQAAVLLGQIVRFDRDRKHRDNLPLEAVDVLSTIVQGQLVEVVDKVLDDLLG